MCLFAVFLTNLMYHSIFQAHTLEARSFSSRVGQKTYTCACYTWNWRGRERVNVSASKVFDFCKFVFFLSIFFVFQCFSVFLVLFVWFLLSRWVYEIQVLLLFGYFTFFLDSYLPVNLAIIEVYQVWRRKCGFWVRLACFMTSVYDGEYAKQ